MFHWAKIQSKNELKIRKQKKEKRFFRYKKGFYICNRNRRNGRVVECGSLENC
jgi:hypothetical protein